MVIDYDQHVAAFHDVHNKLRQAGHESATPRSKANRLLELQLPGRPLRGKELNDIFTIAASHAFDNDMVTGRGAGGGGAVGGSPVGSPTPGGRFGAYAQHGFGAVNPQQGSYGGGNFDTEHDGGGYPPSSDARPRSNQGPGQNSFEQQILRYATSNGLSQQAISRLRSAVGSTRRFGDISDQKTKDALGLLGFALLKSR
jgi:hypothetical protein